MKLIVHAKNYLLLIALVTLLMSCKSNLLFKKNDSLHGIVQLDENQNINQSVDLLLYYPDDIVSNISWQQLSGESISLLANTSKVVSFTPTQAGEYNFSVSFTLNENEAKTLEKTITVNEDEHKVTARLSHAVLAENKVSYRSQVLDNVDTNTLNWEQISGPTVTLTSTDSNGELAIFFDAPRVESDTIITFKVSASDVDNNITYSDHVAVLVEPVPEINENAYFSDRKSIVFPYNSASPYAEILVACVYSNSLSSSCTLEKTPLLAEEVKDSSLPPSIESIMNRVVVSHQWMGDRLRDFLINNDSNNDIKNLLRATTAIVIAYDVRPSFYWAATGAIYLDAENLWLTPEERDTINEAPDFRADFGNDLQFLMPWRYVKNNNYASQSYSKLTRVTRTADDVLYRLSSLLYHELAHANDFFPSNEWYVHSSNQRVLDAALSSDFESDSLAISFPLASQEMRNLGQVSFAGETANQTQINYLPTDIEGFFSPDSASDYYAYSSLREDYAMLFEELMMHSRFAVMRDVAITNQPSGDSISATDYIVTWGQRGRIGDDKLRDRVIFSASRVLPEFDSEDEISRIPAPIQMIAGNNWIENLTISSITSSNKNIKRSLVLDFNGLSTEGRSTGVSAEENAPGSVRLVIPSTEPINSGTRYYQKQLPNH